MTPAYITDIDVGDANVADVNVGTVKHASVRPARSGSNSSRELALSVAGS